MGRDMDFRELKMYIHSIVLELASKPLDFHFQLFELHLARN